MPLFRKRKPRSAATSHDSPYEPPPIEQIRGAAAGSDYGHSPRLAAEDVHNVAFAKPPLGKRGYSEDEVDALLDLIEAVLAGVPGNSLTPGDVRNVAFSKPPIGKRGYSEDDVDAFLDLVEQEIKHRATGMGA
jgi:DivIVA domain-containing protein